MSRQLKPYQVAMQYENQALLNLIEAATLQDKKNKLLEEAMELMKMALELRGIKYPRD